MLCVSTGEEPCVCVCTGAVGAGGRVPNGRRPLILVWGYWGQDSPP